MTGVSPGVGTTAGGTQVLIRGAAFSKSDTFTFGGAPATIFTARSGSGLFVLTPAHAPGVVDVTVTDTDGSSDTLSNVFTYVTPGTSVSLISITPAVGSSAGGTSVTLTGGGFVVGATINFGGAGATDVMFSSATTLTATTPAHPSGAVDVVVANPAGDTATLTGAFTYQ